MSADLPLCALRWRVVFSDEANAALNDIPESLGIPLLTRIAAMATFANPLTAPGVKKLRVDWEGMYRIRHGHHRVIFRLDGDTIRVVDIAHRHECYADHSH